MRYLELKIQASEQGVEQITALLLGMPLRWPRGCMT